MQNQPTYGPPGTNSPGLYSPGYMGSGKKLTKTILVLHILSCLIWIAIIIFVCVAPRKLLEMSNVNTNVSTSSLTGVIAGFCIVCVIGILWLHFLLWLRFSFRFRNEKRRWVHIILLVIDVINTIFWLVSSITSWGLTFPIFLYHAVGIAYSIKVYKDPQCWGCRPFSYENHILLEGRDPVTGYGPNSQQAPQDNKQGGYQQPPSNNQPGGYQQPPLGNQQGGYQQPPLNNQQGGYQQPPLNNQQGGYQPGGYQQGPPNNQQGGYQQGPHNNQQGGYQQGGYHQGGFR